VVEGSAELRLAPEALLDVGGAVGVETLDRDLAPEALVLAEKDRCHPAGAEVLDHPVAAIEQ
jgi:hypothetical protein